MSWGTRWRTCREISSTKVCRPPFHLDFLSVITGYSRRCLLKRAQETSMTLWKGTNGRYTRVISLEVGVQDLPTWAPCRAPVTSQSRALTGRKCHGTRQKTGSGIQRPWYVQPCLCDWVIKGLGMSSCVCVTG